jgi:uncharacterized protein (DUF58 family)
MASKSQSLDQLPSMGLLPQEVINTLGRLEFFARTRKIGSVSGRHASPHKGFSVEFAEHRQYVVGDDLRDLDWRAYGKSDRYYIKQYIEETNMRVTLLVDASGSMKYSGESGGKTGPPLMSKFEYARRLAAAFAYLFVRQGDAVGLVTFDDKIKKYLRAASKPSQVRMILDELHQTEPGSDTAAARTFHEIAERIHSRGLVVIFSDLFDDPDKIVEALHHFRFKNHEILVFHIMSDEELSFPFKKFETFRCLESPRLSLQIDPQSIRSQYLERIQEFLKTIELGCGKMKADYIPVNTRKSITDTLLTYFTSR